jgi:hypothetical protein
MINSSDFRLVMQIVKYPIITDKATRFRITRVSC